MAEQAVEPSYRQVRFSPAPDSCHLFLVRHGESEPAITGRPFDLVDGRGDPSLSEEGIAQSLKVAERLAQLPISAIYVSNLRRTGQSAAPLAQALGLVPIVVSALAEVQMGDWEGGLYRQKIAQRDPLVAEMFRLHRFDVIPGAESNESLIERATAAIAEIATRHANQLVVVYSHAVTISALLAYATNASMLSFITADNASISELVVGGGYWSIRSFNDRGHLS